MPLPPSLNPDDFVIVPDLYVLDEFEMTDDDGNVIATIDATYIRRLVAHMVERQTATGDLCPIVIGHTIDGGMPKGDEEVNGPPLIGYLFDFKEKPFFDTGKIAAAPNAAIYKSEVERAKKFPRRSCEVHVNRYEVDPCSFLGATTPARDLGLLKLARDSSFVYQIGVEGTIFDRPTKLCRSGRCTIPTNRESPAMADEKKEMPKADPKESGAAKGVEGKLDMLLSMMQSWMDKMGSAAAPAAPASAAQPAPDASGAAAGDDTPLSDDELNSYLAQLEGGDDEGAAKGDDKSRKGDEVVKNAAGYAGGDDTNVPMLDDMKKKLARYEEEQSILVAKLARRDVQDRIRTANGQGANIDPEDEKLVTTLVTLPPDMREDMVVRLSRSNRSQTSSNGHAVSALRQSQAGAKRVQSAEDRTEIIKLARTKKVSYEQAATELGFEVTI